MNVVLVISDSLRRDHLGCYNAGADTPHLDRFAEKSRVFDRAYCASFPTMPTRADIMTGRFTFCYQPWGPLKPSERVLAETLSDAGYRTAAVVDTPFYSRRGYAYDRGFEDFLFVKGQEPGDSDTKLNWRYEEDFCAPKTFATAERWLERHYEEDFFLLIDAWDPHEPWDPPPYYVRRYLPDWDGTVVWPPYWYTTREASEVDGIQLDTMESLWTEWERRTEKSVRPDHIVNRALGLVFGVEEGRSTVTVGKTDEHLQIARACYAGEVAMVDRAFGRFMERIESLRLDRNTVVMLTSDHGFYFGEHGIFGKSIMFEGGHVRSPLYEEVAGVPLIVSGPGIEAGTSSALVSLPDLMPTVLELFDVDAPETVQARSLTPLLRSETDRHNDFVVSTTPLQNPGEISRIVDDKARKIQRYSPSTITTDTWSLLYSSKGVPVELYDLENDPEQTINVADEHSEVVKELHGKFIDALNGWGVEERLIGPRSTL